MYVGLLLLSLIGIFLLKTSSTLFANAIAKELPPDAPVSADFLADLGAVLQSYKASIAIDPGGDAKAHTNRGAALLAR